MNPITIGIISVSVLFGCLIVLLVLAIVIICMINHTHFLLTPKEDKDKKEKKRKKYKYTAVIIETTEHPAMKFVLHNIVTNLSEDWGIVVCHGNRNSKYIHDIISKLPTHRFHIQHLPVDYMDISQYNTFLKSPFFFEYIPTEMFLIFQKDSMIINRYKDKINDFLKYDYVGAPWKTPYFGKGNEVGNGGFSLRRKSKMLEILNHSKDTESCEELFYSCPTSIPIHKPSAQEATLFSIETVLVPHSFGCHKPWMYHEHEMLFEMYPEIKELYQCQKR